MFSNRVVADVGLAAPLVLWTITGARWRSATGTPYQRRLWATLLVCALASTLANEAVAETVTGVWASATFWLPVIKHVLVLIAAAMAIELVRDVALPPAMARAGTSGRVLLLVVAISALAAAAVVVVSRTADDVALPGAGLSVPLVLYWLAFLGYLGAALALVVRWAVWFRVHTPPAPVRTGLVLIGAGAALGLCYIVHKVLFILLLAVSPTSVFVRSAALVETAFIAAALGLIAIGCATPAISPRLGGRVRALAAYVELGPLWWRLYRASPAIALVAPNGPRGIILVRAMTDLDVQLYRRVIEIRDGSLALRPFSADLPAGLIERESRRCGIDPRSVPRIVEATDLELARRSKVRGAPARPVARTEVTGGGDVESEVSDLRALARATRSARRVADRIEGEGWV